MVFVMAGVVAGVFALGAAGAAAGDEEMYRELGDEAAAALTGSLVSTLQQKIAEQGAAGAIEFCKTEALPLTAKAGGEVEGVASVRRIGARTRNPANVKDAADREALEEFLRGWNPQAPAGPVVKRVRTAEGKEEVRYYRPIPVVATCLMCHGDPAAMAPDVRAKLRELYPGDEATGFAVGDLRGAIVVTFKEGAGGR